MQNLDEDMIWTRNGLSTSISMDKQYHLVVEVGPDDMLILHMQDQHHSMIFGAESSLL
jgi:hypothetical protein